MHAEVAKYNSLLELIRTQVGQLQIGLDGESLLDSEKETILLSILSDTTPANWISKSYPGSLSLPNYLSNLQDRVGYIKEVLE